MRFAIEEPCPHGNVKCATLGFIYDTSTGKQRRICPGGTRTVFEGLPETMIEQGATGIVGRWFREDGRTVTMSDAAAKSLARSVLEAALGLGHDQ
jgi:rubredoxin